MILKLVTPPAAEPVTLAELKAQCRVDLSDDDSLLTNLITEARQMVEEVSRRALINQTWRLSLHSWPAVSYIRLPRAPLFGITSLVYTDAAGTPTTWAAANYLTDTDSEPGRLVLAHQISWPATAELYPVNPIQVTFVAGYGATSGSVPARWKRAILLLAAHWYENREATISGTIAREIPLAVSWLIQVDRVY